MTPELAAALLFLVVLIVIEYRYIRAGQPTISERIRALFARYPPFGFLVGLVAGLFLGHWFWST